MIESNHKVVLQPGPLPRDHSLKKEFSICVQPILFFFSSLGTQWVATINTVNLW